MPTPRPAANEDRLPWLEPYREPKSGGGQLPRRGYGRPIGIGLVLALLMAAAGIGYWLGLRSIPRAGESDIVAVPPPRQEPAPVAQAPAEPRLADAEPLPAPAAEAPGVKRAAANRAAKRPARKRIRTAGIESARLRAVRAAQERPAPRRAWPRMPSPGPAGQVIQLGAYSNASRAHVAYRARIERYPVLARMPRVIVPVITKPGNRVLYVLRLGTSSRQQSKIVCRNLRASGDHCLVIG